MRKTVYEGPAEGFWAPEPFCKFMTTTREDGFCPLSGNEFDTAVVSNYRHNTIAREIYTGDRKHLGTLVYDANPPEETTVTIFGSQEDRLAHLEHVLHIAAEAFNTSGVAADLEGFVYKAETN